MRYVFTLLAAAVVAAWLGSSAFAEGVSSKDLVADTEVAPVKKEASPPPQITTREVKPASAQEETKKSRGKELNSPVTGDIITTGKTKDVFTLSGGKGSDTESNVGSIKVSK